MRVAENEECRNCEVWKMRSAENVKKISIFHLPILSVENEACVIRKSTNNF